LNYNFSAEEATEGNQRTQVQWENDSQTRNDDGDVAMAADPEIMLTSVTAEISASLALFLTVDCLHSFVSVNKQYRTVETDMQFTLLMAILFVSDD